LNSGIAWVVRRWIEHFETPESLKRKRCGSWVAMPNKQDGRGYKRIMDEPDGRNIYGTWCAVVQMASKMPVRGLLADLDGPLSPEDIATKVLATTEEVERMIAIVSEPRIDWIEQVKWNEDASFEENVAALTETRQIPDFPFMRDGNPSGVKKNRQAEGQHGRATRENQEMCWKSVTPDGFPSGVNGNRVHNSTLQTGQFPPTVPQGGQEENVLGFDEAKTFLSELFGRQKRRWSYEEDSTLAQIVPIPRRTADLIAAWFRLPDDHPIFSERHNPHTKRKQEMTTLLRDWNGELDKAQRFAPFFMASENGQQKKEPGRWRELFQWLYSPDIILPQSFYQLDQQQRQEYERNFETFVEATSKAVAAAA
jgi:hypothetical protein